MKKLWRILKWVIIIIVIIIFYSLFSTDQYKDIFFKNNSNKELVKVPYIPESDKNFITGDEVGDVYLTIKKGGHCIIITDMQNNEIASKCTMSTKITKNDNYFSQIYDEYNIIFTVAKYYTTNKSDNEIVVGKSGKSILRIYKDDDFIYFDGIKFYKNEIFNIPE